MIQGDAHKNLRARQQPTNVRDSMSNHNVNECKKILKIYILKVSFYMLVTYIIVYQYRMVKTSKILFVFVV